MTPWVCSHQSMQQMNSTSAMTVNVLLIVAAPLVE